MFGHDNHDDQTQDSQAIQPEPVADATLSAADDLAAAHQAAAAAAPPEPPAPLQDDTPAFDAPSAPTVSNDAGSYITSDNGVAPNSTVSAPESTPAGSDDLISIKQQALQQLSPLLGHLDQTPEEKFRTTMMMIQASDDQSLINEAYAAAKGITDEKAQAQALLDIVNEINYFTQQNAA